MGRYEVQIKATGEVEFEVEADNEDEAVAKAWAEFGASSPHPANWDAEITYWPEDFEEDEDA